MNVKDHGCSFCNEKTEQYSERQGNAYIESKVYEKKPNGEPTLMRAINQTLQEDGDCFICNTNVTAAKLVSQPCVDFFCHDKSHGLPFGDPSSVTMETLFRILKMNYRIIQRVKPAAPSYIIIHNKIYSGTLAVVDIIKNITGICLNYHLTHKESAITRFITTAVENQTETCLLYHRWVDQIKEWRQTTTILRGFGLLKNMFLETKIQRRIRCRLEMSGLNSASSEQILCTLVRDLHCFSVLLGDNAYLFGSLPTSLDCLCFGIVSNLIYSTIKSNAQNIITNNFSNLINHCERIKSIYWPDWEKVVGKWRGCATPRFFFSFRKPAPTPKTTSRSCSEVPISHGKLCSRHQINGNAPHVQCQSTQRCPQVQSNPINTLSNSQDQNDIVLKKSPSSSTYSIDHEECRQRGECQICSNQEELEKICQDK